MKKYDIVVIGSGLGGLSTALILAINGYKVCVLEKNHQIGGTLQTFNRKGCCFDTGLHYLGSLDEGQILHKFFKYFDILDKLEVRRMDEDGFDIINIAGKEYRYGMGYANFEKQLLVSFPNEKEAIQKYIKRIQEVSDSFDLYNMRYPVVFDFDAVSALTENLQEFLDSITDNDELKNVLAALNVLYAQSPEDTSLYMHALINNYYINSGYKVLGGGQKLADAIKLSIEERGGEVITKKEVTEFIFNDNVISHVKTKDGEEFYADKFISNMHPEVTIDLVGEDRFRKAYVNRIKRLRNGISNFAIYFKLKNKNFPVTQSNYHYYKENSVWGVATYNEKEWPKSFLLYTPEDNEDAEYTDCISAFTYMDFSELDKWKDTTVEKRGDDYKQWKKEKSEKFIALLESVFPEFKDNIESYYTSSPLTYRDYIGTKDGAMYGIIRDSRNPTESQIMPKTRVPNLLLTGQNINLHGSLGVIISSVVTCGEIIGVNELVQRFNKVVDKE